MKKQTVSDLIKRETAAYSFLKQKKERDSQSLKKEKDLLKSLKRDS